MPLLEERLYKRLVCVLNILGQENASLQGKDVSLMTTCIEHFRSRKKHILRKYISHLQHVLNILCSVNATFWQRAYNQILWQEPEEVRPPY